MSQIPYIFNQLCNLLDRTYFDYLVKQTRGNRYVKRYSCWSHLLTMIWAQLTARKSLRDIECSLRAHTDKIYRFGIGKSVSRSTIAESNATRDVSIYRCMAERMIASAGNISIIKSELGEVFAALEIAGLLAVDSSTIHLSLSRFPWSVPQRNGGGIKLHTMFDILREIPVTCLITGSQERDQTFMDDYTYRPDCMYLFDKAYVKTSSLYGINQANAFFVVRKKENMCIEIISSDPDANSKNIHVISDNVIRFTSRWAKTGYPQSLRMVCYYSSEKNKVLTYLTNNFDVPAEIIALAYKNRWAIELFFKWIKQHLYIETFYGTSLNAVSIQIYTAITTYCLVAKFADQFKLKCSIYELFRVLGVSLTERTYLIDWVKSFEKRERNDTLCSLMPSLFE